MVFLSGGWEGWLFFTTPIEDISESAHYYLSDRNAETRPLAAHILRRAQEQLWQARRRVATVRAGKNKDLVSRPS